MIKFDNCAQVVKLVDTRDLKSSKETSCRFKSGPGHHDMLVKIIKTMEEKNIYKIKDLISDLWEKKYLISASAFIFGLIAALYVLTLQYISIINVVKNIRK